MASTATTANYQEVTDKILEALEKGVIPWRKPWTALKPQNAVSKKPYRGVNVFLLGMTEFSDPRWLTFKQALDLGGNVKKGEKGTKIYFWKWLKGKDKDDPSKSYSFPILRAYTVFNVTQCENLKLAPLPEAPNVAEVVDVAEAVIQNMPNKPPVGFGGARAYYHPREDRVQMPPRETFKSTEGYYSTFFHELGHSTGHESRLDRKEVTKAMVMFGDNDYSQEELVAELTASFLCNEVGISNDAEMENSAAYLRGWLNALKGDKKLLVIAAGQAQKAADYILNLQAETEVAEAA